MSIPFAKRITDGSMVDASSVARGRGCGCVCPSCSAALIARQGEVREWHFAHATSDSKAEDVCKYSALVSIRLMSHQIVAEIDSIELPRAPSESRTAPRNTDIESINVDARFEGVIVDALATVKGISLALYMTYKSREVPPALREPSDKKAGILEIDLHAVWRILQTTEYNQSDRGYVAQHFSQDKLTKILMRDVSCKRWVYHPRQEQQIRQDQRPTTGVKLVSLEQLGVKPVRPDIRTATNNPKEDLERAAPIPDNSPLMAKYSCQICCETWIAGHNDRNAESCPKCKTLNVSKEALFR